MADEVPNPYKAAIGRAIPTVRGHAGTAAAALDGAKKAFAANAWTGGTSAAFGADLNGRAGTVKTAGDACVTELQDMHDKQPDKVAPGDWQTRWRNL